MVARFVGRCTSMFPRTSSRAALSRVARRAVVATIGLVWRPDGSTSSRIACPRSCAATRTVDCYGPLTAHGLSTRSIAGFSRRLATLSQRAIDADARVACGTSGWLGYEGSGRADAWLTGPEPPQEYEPDHRHYQQSEYFDGDEGPHQTLRRRWRAARQQLPRRGERRTRFVDRDMCRRQTGHRQLALGNTAARKSGDPADQGIALAQLAQQKTRSPRVSMLRLSTIGVSQRLQRGTLWRESGLGSDPPLTCSIASAQFAQQNVRSPCTTSVVGSVIDTSQ
jgi:hypothetical protein